MSKALSRGAEAGTSHRLHIPKVGGMKHPLPRSNSGPTAQNTKMSTSINTPVLDEVLALRALIDKGLVKLQNFQQNPQKLKYAYLLTPQGAEEKTRMTLAFLRRKEAEYQALQAEIVELRERVGRNAEGQSQ